MEKFETFEFVQVEENLDSNYGKFVAEPLERGFARTIGNALRRVLLSSLPGGAVFSIEMLGVSHEFTPIPSVEEDVSAMILNIKDLILNIDTGEPVKLHISEVGPKEVTAADIQLPAGVEIVNEDLVIAHIAEGGKLDVTLNAANCRGYVSSNINKQIYKNAGFDINSVYTDSIGTPVLNVAYDVEVDPTRIGAKRVYERLTMEVTTNGSITPSNALALAAKILRDHLDKFTVIFNGVKDNDSVIDQKSSDNTNSTLVKSIEDLDLSVRSFNCLKRGGIQTVEELTKKTEDEMMRFRNLGKKSLKEVQDKMQELGLSFKNNG
ncbi:MAG: DNA-directed RNA polymerase subunit alpha [Erysipelotrichaceae bacterium]